MFGSSQGFGYGGDAAAPTQEAPKAKKQEEKQTCLPVTVRILQDAVAKHADSQEVIIHGAEVSIVHIVGVIENFVKQTAMVEFQINDATGRMKVRYYGSGSGSMEDLTGLTNGAYVSVVGNLRTSPAAHVSAMSLQPVQNADAVSYHSIEVVHAALRLRNPTTLAPVGLGMGAADPVTPAKLQAGTNLSPAKLEAPVPVPMAVQGDLRSSVMEVLRKVQESGNDVGLDVTTLVARLPQGSSSQKVNDVLSQLVTDGEAFTTIDDNHFAMI